MFSCFGVRCAVVYLGDSSYFPHLKVKKFLKSFKSFKTFGNQEPRTKIFQNYCVHSWFLVPKSFKTFKTFLNILYGKVLWN